MNFGHGEVQGTCMVSIQSSMVRGQSRSCMVLARVVDRRCGLCEEGAGVASTALNSDRNGGMAEKHGEGARGGV